LITVQCRNKKITHIHLYREQDFNIPDSLYHSEGNSNNSITTDGNDFKELSNRCKISYSSCINLENSKPKQFQQNKNNLIKSCLTNTNDCSCNFLSHQNKYGKIKSSHQILQHSLIHLLLGYHSLSSKTLHR